MSALRDLLERATDNAGKIAFKATRIIARFIAKKNPIFNALSSIWKAKEVYQKIDKVYKLYDKLNDFSPQILEKMAVALKKIGNKGLLKRFTDTQNSQNLAGHYNVDISDSTVDAFLNALSEAFGVPWVNGNDWISGSSSPGAKHLPLRSNQGAGANTIAGMTYFEYYPRSSSTGEPSIHIKISGKSFKFRLN